MRAPIAAPAPRTRVVNTSAKVVSARTKGLARTFFEENTAKNLHNTTADKARKELFKTMKDDGIDSFTMTTSVNGKTQTLEVSLNTPENSTIDIAQLRKLVDEATFLKIVSASITSVNEVVGVAISSRCTITKPGKETVNVTVAK